MTVPSAGRKSLYLNPFLGDGKLVEVEDGGLDDVDRRQDGHTDVDGVAPFRVQNQNLRLLVLSPFLKKHHVINSKTSSYFDKKRSSEIMPSNV